MYNKSNIPVESVSFDEENVTSLENPFVLRFPLLYSLSINKEYYLKNKEQVDKIIALLARNTISTDFLVEDSLLINDELLKILSENPNIFSILLGTDKNGYNLKKSDYEILKGSDKVVYTNGVEEELKEVYDPVIEYNYKKNILGNYTYNNLTKYSCLIFESSLSEEEISNFKYVGNQLSSISFKYDDYDNIFYVIDKVKKSFPSVEIKIEVENKQKFSNYLFNEIQDLDSTNGIIVRTEDDLVSLLDYIKYEKKLMELVMPAMMLSPLERYLYAYNIVKQFKKYKESHDDLSLSRDLYKLLDNEYMVCVGFSTLLGDLLDKLGIDNADISVDLELGLDKVANDVTVLPDYVIDKKTGERVEVVPDKGAHARKQIHIVDEKYGIDGYFLADPTWDNDLENDSYVFSLMSNDEYNSIRRYNYIRVNDINELFFVKSIEEFYNKVMFLINRREGLKIEEYILLFMERFKTLDSEFYNYLVNKYDGLDKCSYSSDIAKYNINIENIMFDIGERIVLKSNKMVDGYTFRDAITTLYRDVYGITDENELEKRVSETMEFNKNDYYKRFPKRIKSDRFDNEEIVMNGNNKFDIDSEPNLGI